MILTKAGHCQKSDISRSICLIRSSVSCYVFISTTSMAYFTKTLNML